MSLKGGHAQIDLDLQISSKREILDDITTSAVNKMNNTQNTSEHSPIHQTVKKQRTNLQAPKFSLDKLKLQNEKQSQVPQIQRFSSEDAIRLAKLSAGFNDELPLAPNIEEMTIQDKLEENQKAFRAELLKLQIQIEKQQHDSVELRQTINELEHINKKIKINTQKLKEELFEINSEVDELEMMTYNKNTQNQKVYKLKEKELKLESQLLENELNVELHNMEKTLKHEYQEVILKYNDEIALKEVQELQTKLSDKISEYELILDKTKLELSTLEQDKAKQYEADLKSIEDPLGGITNDIESSKIELQGLNEKLKKCQNDYTRIVEENIELRHKLDHHLKVTASGEETIKSYTKEAKELAEQVASKRQLLQVSLSDVNEAHRFQKLESSKLLIERAKKRRILHEIYDLKGKFRCCLKLSNADVEISEKELDKKCISTANQVFEVDLIHLEGNIEFLEDIQILVEDSLKGLPVTVVSMGNAKDSSISNQIAKIIDRLIDKLSHDAKVKSYDLHYQHADLVKQFQNGVMDPTVPMQTNFKDILLIAEPSLLRCNISISTKSRSFQSQVDFIFSNNSIDDLKHLIHSIKHQIPMLNTPLLHVYRNTKTLTVFNIDFAKDDYQNWLTIAANLNDTDSPITRKRK